MAESDSKSPESPTVASSRPGSVRMSSSRDVDDDMAKGDVNDVEVSSLFSPALPDRQESRLALLTIFFNRSQLHYGLNFIHGPLFMKSFREGTAEDEYGRPLLLAMCALAARFCFYEGFSRSDRSAWNHDESEPGEAWADHARAELMVDLRLTRVSDLMALAVLCAYEMQREEYAQASMLAAVLQRGVVLNGFIHEQRPGISNSIERETERRLAWASFTLDALVANYSRRHMSWDEAPQISLPRSSSDFRLGKMGDPIFLRDFHSILTKVDQLEIHVLNILAIYVHHSVLRTRDVESSENASGNRQCFSIKAFQDTKNTVRRILDEVVTRFHPERNGNQIQLARRGLLGPYFSLRCRLHLLLIDLARGPLILPETSLSEHYENMPASFKALMLATVRKEASNITNLVRVGMEWERSMGFTNKNSPLFDDPTCIRAVVEAVKVSIIYGAFHTQNDKELSGALGDIRSGINFLEGLDRVNVKMKRLLLSELMLMCNLFGHDEILRLDEEGIQNGLWESPDPKLQMSEEPVLSQSLTTQVPAEVRELSAVTGLSAREIEEAMMVEVMAGLAPKRPLTVESKRDGNPLEGESALKDAAEDDDIEMLGQAPEA